MESNRRSFLKSTAPLAAPLFVPRGAWGANDRPTFATIGTGSRGRGLHAAFQKIGAQCVAVCDVYAPNIEEARKISPPGVRTFGSHQDLLAMPGLDFVVIATPDHHHKPQLLDALGAGKDVYLEKPLSMNLGESAEMVAAVRRTDRVVQIGMQRRSMPFVHQAKKLIDAGALGRISLVKAKWNWHFTVPLDNSPLDGKLDWERFLGNAPRRPLEPRRFRWWRGFYDYSGGNMTDQGTHLMDVVQWMTNNGPPKSAVCQGYIHDAKEGEVPDVFCAVFEYPDLIASWTLDYSSSYEYDWSIHFQGEKAAMAMDRFGYKIYKDSGASRTPWFARADVEVIDQLPDKDSATAHQQNFLDCIRLRKQPNCPIETAAAAVAGPHMANLALREDRKIRMGAGARPL